MKFKMWNYIHQSTRNSMRNAKNTVEGGLGCVVCERSTKNARKRPKRYASRIKILARGCYFCFVQRSTKLKMWNYIHQSTRNSMRNAKNTVEGGLGCVVCEISAKNAQKRPKRYPSKIKILARG